MSISKMSAIVTVLRETTSENIQVYVDPKERIEDIISRCKDYWRLEGSLDDYVLIRNNMKLPKDKTVISSDIREGDVIRFCRKDRDDEQKSRTKKSETNTETDKDPVTSSKDWLRQNLGLDVEDLKAVKKLEEEDSTKIVFKNQSIDQNYTVTTKNGEVQTYIPAVVEDIDLNGG